MATTHSTEATAGARAGQGLAVLERVAVTLVLAGAAALLLSRLDEPFDESGATQRLFGALRPWSDLLGQPDFRHPALFFVFLRASLRLEEWLGYEAVEAFARLPAALAAWVAAFLAWRAVRRTLGPLRSLAVLVVLVACPPFLLHARDVGNLTLFMALVVGTSAWMASLIARASRPALAGFAVLETLMFFTNHLAILVWAVHAATVAVHARGRTRRWLLAALAASAILAFKPLSDLGAAIPVDMGLRQAARAHPDLLCGEVGVTDYLGQALAEFITLDGWGVAVALLVGLGALRLARRVFQSAFAFLHLALVLGIPAGLAVASSLLRLQPSYLGFLAPSFAVLVACGATGFPSGGPPSVRPWWRFAVGPMLAVAAVAVMGRDAGVRAFGTASQDGYRVLGRFLKALPGGRSWRPTITARPPSSSTTGSRTRPPWSSGAGTASGGTSGPARSRSGARAPAGPTWPSATTRGRDPNPRGSRSGGSSDWPPGGCGTSRTSDSPVLADWPHRSGADARP